MEAVDDLSSLLTDLGRRYGNATAVFDDRGTTSFARLDEAAARWANALAAAGAGRGTTVALLAANSATWLAVAFGVWRAGATLVPVSTFATANEIATTLDHADASLLILESGFGSRDLVADVVSLRSEGAIRTAVLLDGPGREGILGVDDFLDAPPRKPDAPVAADDVACILYTSGTTGRPKGVRLTHRSILATIAPTAAVSGLGSGDRVLSSLPLFWVAGLVIRTLPTLACGSALIFLRRFTAEAAVAVLRRQRPTGIHLRPPQVAAILASEGTDTDLFASVRRGNGRRDWFQGALHAEATLVTGYGMTEMSGYVTALDYRDSETERARGVGTTLPGVDVRIVDDGGAPLSPGATGRIQVRGPGMFAGYHKEPAGTGMTPDGWFDTGDLGTVDADGRFAFSGRSKDLLRVKGINVSPLEVEAVLGEHPDIESIYVVGVPEGALEQRVVALVVLKEGGTELPEEALRALAREMLSTYKRPETYLRIDRARVPFGATSKPQRSALARLAEDLSD